MPHTLPSILCASLVLSLAVTPCLANCALQIAPACAPIQLDGAVFLGEVVGARVITTQMEGTAKVFRLRVIETFAGSQQSGDTVEVLSWTAEAYPFVVGQRYLVYASDSRPKDPEDPVRLSTTVCSNTAPDYLSAVELNELRTRVSGGRYPDLNGQILAVEGIGQPSPDEAKPLAGIQMTFTSTADGSSLHAVTDQSGIYTVPTMPPGTYTVRFDLLPKRVPLGLSDGKPPLITIPEAGTRGADCHYSMHAAPSGNITGQIVGSSGAGVAGFVAAYLATQSARLGWSAATSTDAQGHFKLEFLRDGDYRLEFSGTDHRKEYVSQASIHDGQSSAGIQLTVPSQ